MATINITLKIPNTGEYTKGEIIAKIKGFVKELTNSPENILVSEKKCHHSRMTDEQLDMALKNESSFDECKYTELSDEQYRQIKRTHRPLARGLEKWL